MREGKKRGDRPRDEGRLVPGRRTEARGEGSKEGWQRQGSRIFSGLINARGKGFPLSRRFRPRSMVSGAGQGANEELLAGRAGGRQRQADGAESKGKRRSKRRPKLLALPARHLRALGVGSEGQGREF